MPFQDIDDTPAAERSSPPGIVDRTIRKIFVEDWALKLLALAITLALWFAVTGVNTPTTILTPVRLNFLLPENLEISNDPPKSVDVLLTGSPTKLNGLSLPNLVATIDLTRQQPGLRTLRLSSTVYMEVPEGVKIEYLQPTTIPVRLEPKIERAVDVEVKLSGTPAEGYQLYRAIPNPSSIVVRGPASQVEPLLKLETEPISLERMKESFVAHGVSIDLHENKVDLATPDVDVAIEIGPKSPAVSSDSSK